MRVVSFGEVGGEQPGVLLENDVLDLRAADPTLPPTWREILSAGRLDRVRKLAGSPASGCLRGTAGLRLGPPITNPSKIICIGLNYADHAAEQNRPLPEKPLLFAKAPTALSGTGDAIVLPTIEAKVDVEAELAVVVGRRAKHVKAADWQTYVAGFMCFNDVSGRGAQYSDRQFFRGKSFDTFAPCGPYLATLDEIPDPHELAIRSTINDFVLQESRTSELVFRIPHLLEYITQGITLLPGDIIATGTPAGVGVFRDPPLFLKEGDQVSITIDGLGRLSNPIRAEPAG